MSNAAYVGPGILPYDEHQEQAAWKKDIDRWKWHPVPGSRRWRAEGNCPRCGHPTEMEVEETVRLVTALGPGGDVKFEKPANVEFYCFCSETHEQDKTGCGLRISAVKGP